MKPDVQALLVAERVWKTESEGYVIAGTFTHVNFFRKIASTTSKAGDKSSQINAGGAGAPWVYISLTNVSLNTEIQIQFTCLKKNHPIFGSKIKIDSEDRLATVQMALQLPDLSTVITNEGEGYYAIEVIYEDEIIGSYRISTVTR